MTKTVTQGISWTVPIAGFANPRYFADDPTDATGFDISDCVGYSLGFEGTGVSTVVHEQTNDPKGLAGWFPVFGKILDQSAATLAQGGSLTGKGYLFAAAGMRARIRVTALTTGDAVVRVVPMKNLGDIASTAAAVAATGGAAEDGVQFGNPSTVAAEARTTNKAAMSTNGDVVRMIATMIGALIIKPFSIPELDWQNTGTKTDTTDLVVKTAAGAGIKNYMTALQYQNTSATATVIVVKQGSTEIWRGNAAASMAVPANVQFPTPLQSAANAALNVACLTTASNTIISAQGYAAP